MHTVIQASVICFEAWVLVGAWRFVDQLHDLSWVSSEAWVSVHKLQASGPPTACEPIVRLCGTWFCNDEQLFHHQHPKQPPRV